jgi:exoribonuclease-2
MSDRTLLESVARRAMQQYGLEPDFPAAALTAASSARATAPDGVRDLRNLPWSSIDNDESRDLDQLEVCDGESGSASRVLVAIADVDAFVAQGDAVDSHAQTNTTSVYTAARIFPMLPETLSTDKTSLLPDVDRAAIVIQLHVDAAGLVQQSDVYRAMVRNRAKLTYDEVGAWLEGRGPAPAALAKVDGLEAQLRQQDRIAQALRANRQAQGALDFDRAEIRPVMDGDRIGDLKAVAIGRARDLIEDFMIAANGVTSAFLASRG